METPHKRFAAWVASLGARGVNRRAAAVAMGCHVSYVGLVARGERTPGRRRALAIERATHSWADGPLYAEEWDRAAKAAATESAA